MNSTLPQYIEIRQNRRGLDRPYIVGTRVRVQDIVIYHERYGYSADDIASSHLPHLSIAQVHAALTYFHEDREAIWNCIREDAAFAEQMREQLTGERPIRGEVGTDASETQISP